MGPGVSQPTQLTFDGGEVAVGSTSPLSPVQREIVALMRNYGVITSTAAGRIVHAHREDGCQGCRMDRCKYAASDGGDALRRLQERGMVRKVARGSWKIASA